MTKKEATQIAKIWNGDFRHFGSTDATKTIAIVQKGTLGYDVEIHPYGDENDGKSFHHAKSLTAIAATFHKSFYIAIRDNIIIGCVF